MAVTNSVGSLTTALASLGTLFFTIMSFSLASQANQISFLNSGQGFVGFAVLGWLGVIFLAFGWASAAYTFEKKHYWLALTGSALILTSCAVEYEVLLYAPHSPIVPPLAFTWGGIIIMQTIAAILGVFFTAIAKRKFK
jgi:hypothetical protein